jgi:hypothetical protein
MAKKSRRARKKSVRSVSQTAVQAAEAAKSAAVAAVEPAADQQEYAYVIADLRQVVILAAAMFALLVGLSFFIS